MIRGEGCLLHSSLFVARRRTTTLSRGSLPISIPRNHYATHSPKLSNPPPLPSLPPSIVRLSNSSLPEELITQELLLKPISAMEKLDSAFAVVHVGGHQYKVTEGDEIMVEKIEAPVTAKLLLDKVLLVGTREHTVIGTPLLTKAKVHVQVEEQSRAEKVIVFNKRSDTKSGRKRNGNRQPYTLLRILGIMVEKE